MPISTPSGARSGVGAESRTPSSPARSSANVITRVGAAGERDRVFKPAFARGVEGRINSIGDLADVREQFTAVEDRRGSELSDERLVALTDGADHVEPLPNGELRGDDSDRAACAQDQERLALRNARAGVALRRPPQPTRAARPASFQITSGGFEVQRLASAYSPYPPSDGSRAATSSPTATPLTSLPTASTTPAVSNPRTARLREGK